MRKTGLKMRIFAWATVFWLWDTDDRKHGLMSCESERPHSIGVTKNYSIKFITFDI